MKDMSTWETHTMTQISWQNHPHCSLSGGKYPTIKGKKHRRVAEFLTERPLFTRKFHTLEI